MGKMAYTSHNDMPAIDTYLQYSAVLWFWKNGASGNRKSASLEIFVTHPPPSSVGEVQRRGLSRRRMDQVNLPVSRHPRSILQRLGQMAGRNLLCPGQIGDGARQLEHPVVGTRRELQLHHGGLHQRPPGIVQLAEVAHLGRAHVCIAGNRGGVFSLPVETLALHLPCRLHPPLQHRRRLSQPAAAQLVVLHARHFHVDVDAI